MLSHAEPMSFEVYKQIKSIGEIVGNCFSAMDIYHVLKNNHMNSDDAAEELIIKVSHYILIIGLLGIYLGLLCCSSNKCLLIIYIYNSKKTVMFLFGCLYEQLFFLNSFKFYYLYV